MHAGIKFRKRPRAGIVPLLIQQGGWLQILPSPPIPLCIILCLLTATGEDVSMKVSPV